MSQKKRERIYKVKEMETKEIERNWKNESREKEDSSTVGPVHSATLVLKKFASAQKPDQ